jgi:hypothetical protein
MTSDHTRGPRDEGGADDREPMAGADHEAGTGDGGTAGGPAGGTDTDQTPTAAQPTTGASTDTAAVTGAGPRLVPWTHRPTTSEGSASATTASSGAAAGAAAGGSGAAPTSSGVDDDVDVDLDDEPERRRVRPAVVLAVVGGAAVVAVVLGTVLAFTDGGPLAAGAPAATRDPAAATTPSARPSSTPTAAPTPTPTASPSPSPRAATPPPQEAAEEAPYITPIPAGTVVANGDVTSPKGSIHFRYRVVAVGDGTFSAEWSDITSTLPVSVQAAFVEIAPSVGDGITAPGDGAALLAVPGSGTTSTSSVLPIGQPSYLRTLVVSTADAPPDAPVEISTGKVLAVAPVAWSVPARATNIAPVDSGATAFASGTVTATTAAGAPKRYLVAADDLTDVVAQRFGISVSALIYLNQGLEVLDAEQHLLEGTTLILDPDSL